MEKQIEEWQPVASEQKRPLNELKNELARMQRHQECARGDFLPKAVLPASVSTAAAYVAFPEALRKLEQQLPNPTTEELAAWIFIGQEHGGIAAYRNANQFNPAPRFYFAHVMGEDYLAPMMACWFLKNDIQNFNPTDRYITGKALIERWGKQSGVKAVAFIQAKIQESRLIDLHPTFGVTRGTEPEDDTFPPLEAGLFSWTDVQRIEAEDGLVIPPAAGDSEAPITDTESSVPTALTAAGATTCAEFRAMTGMRSHEVSIALVGDKTEGLAGNNMLEIRARGVTRRVSLAEFDLVDRRHGKLNKQAAVLIGLANGQILRRSDQAISATMKRLRATLEINWA